MRSIGKLHELGAELKASLAKAWLLRELGSSDGVF
jgi:hypothetical protein